LEEKIPSSETDFSSCVFLLQAQKLGIMEDEKAGVPRTAYLGVVQVRSKAGANLYVAPEGGVELYQQG